MSIVFRLALTAFLFPLCGCAYDFGDQAEQFVKNEAYAWSKKMLVADLTVRWPNFFRAWVTQLAVDLDELSQTTANMSIIAPPTSDDDAEKKAVLALVWIDKTKRLTLRNQEKVARIIDSFSLLNNICSDPVAFDGFGLKHLAAVSPLTSLRVPPHDLKLYLGYSSGSDSASQENGDQGVWYNMFDSMRSLLGKNEYDEQMSKFEKAKKNYFTSIVQPEESFQISKTICEGALAAQNDQIKALQDAVHQYAQLYQTEVEAAQLLEDAANATLSAGLINLAMSQTGVLFLFTQWQEEKLTARILQDLAGAMVEMRSLQQTPAKAETCLDLLRGVDAARDAFQELNAQLTTLPAFISSVDVKERLEDRLLQASTAQNTLEQQLPYLSAGLCQ